MYLLGIDEPNADSLLASPFKLRGIYQICSSLHSTVTPGKKRVSLVEL
uniref:Uncharacterized protein n=1 Tax=Anguilla anguilla TaxID=7936 RepID=A0A0E9WSI6_ANGAN